MSYSVKTEIPEWALEIHEDWSAYIFYQCDYCEKDIAVPIRMGRFEEEIFEQWLTEHLFCSGAEIDIITGERVLP